MGLGQSAQVAAHSRMIVKVDGNKDQIVGAMSILVDLEVFVEKQDISHTEYNTMITAVF